MRQMTISALVESERERERGRDQRQRDDTERDDRLLVVNCKVRDNTDRSGINVEDKRTDK